MPEKLDDDTWDLLIRRIREGGRCTPFLGAGACYGALPLGSELAQSWSDQFGFTFGNTRNLVEVAQYLAVRFDALRPKELILERFRGISPPHFDEPDEPHGLLAELPLAVYVTTNYDDFLYRALDRHQFREPVRDYCRWHEGLRDQPSPLNDDFRPHAARPVVYHLHGMLDLNPAHRDNRRDVALLKSLVLTEDDYLAFLTSMTRNETLLPRVIREALRDNTCLFIGYRLADWNLRVLLHALRPDLRSKSIAVLPLPGQGEEERAAAQRYFDEYYRRALDLDVYWGTAREFCGELRQRLAAAS